MDSRIAGIAVFFALAFSLVGFAQLSTGTISGTVTDQSGAVIPGAAITIKDLDTGALRKVVANEAGRYSADALPVGNYEVTVSLTGFQSIVRSGIELTVGRNAVVDIALSLGNVTDTITVAEAVSQIETTTATVANLIDERKVLDIPLNNRDLTQLAYFTPGVLRVPLTITQGNTNTAVGGFGDKLSVNGARSQQNLYLLNGIPNSDASGNAQAATGAYSGAETIKEFQVITNSYSAEYPSVAGAILSAVTKSGTNAVHGTLFEFLRNDKLDAAKWETNAFGTPKPAFKRNQFGGSVGAPIVKDHTFLFASYEGLRERQGTTTTFTTITAGPRTGAFGPVSPLVAPYLSLWPLPGEDGTRLVTDFGDGRALVAGTNQRPVSDDYASLKLDHQFKGQKKGMLAFYYNRDEGKVDNINALKASGNSVGQRSRTELMSVQHTSILSASLLNEFIFGYTKTKPEGAIPIGPINYKNFNGVDLRFSPDREQMGSLSISNITAVGYVDDSTSPGHNSLIFKDGVSLTRQKHAIKLGGQFQRSMDHIKTITTQGNGLYNFTSLQNFLAAKPMSLTINLPNGAPVLGMKVQQDPFYDLRQNNYAMYFQDNYTATPSLTLNFGLRYEVSSNPTELRNHLNSLRSVYSTQVYYGPLYENPTLKNLSPRLGFAWSPGAHKFSVRAGAGIYYETPSLFSTQFNLQAMFPYGVAGSVTDTASSGLIRFPDAYTAQPQLLTVNPQARYMQYDMKSAAIYRWSLTLEREFGAWLVSTSYTGSRALHLLLQFEANTTRWDGFPNDVPTLQKNFRLANGYINPSFGRLTVQAPVGNSFYHGLTVNLRRRLAKGLQFQGAYTYSKAIDQGASSVNVQDSLAQTVRTSYYFDLGMTKGRSLFDMRNNFVGNLVYDLPKSRLTGFAGGLINGWQLSGVLTLAAGFPFSLSDAGNTAQRAEFFSQDGLRPNLVPGGNNNPILGSPNLYYDVTQFVPSTCSGARVCRPGDPDYRTGHYGNLGYNTLTGPGYRTFDFSILKNISVTEASRFQFRTEFFNLTNHPNFFIPNAGPFLSNGTRDPQAGKITQTRGTARQIQFALKYIF
ncbi:MAG: hypothetical protein DMG14_12685 [Acidobacteria bacterium]|nr:MAG: hypothetical protein DMG14_12685 [Acidobacteriota bacterium]